MLDRFVEAQEEVFPTALHQLRAGQKRSHWMWFVFPQLAGLGRSATAQFYGISSADEALSFLGHPILGPRLLNCCAAMMNWAGRRTAADILGPVDAMKLKSSMTLFEQVAAEPKPFADILANFYDGTRDETTLSLLSVER
ncbi:DUF1810 domain-containing protein [Croceicoccus ponticola]